MDDPEPCFLERTLRPEGVVGPSSLDISHYDKTHLQVKSPALGVSLWFPNRTAVLSQVTL